ncbi:MAG TPA: DUF1549 and DUF1553 domain-containing protein [Humisphaera sp.]|jgi:hypothetical protein|nr:DUF1549 and DUF1553 domain-containing protein [Humisphaera sp.]
MPAVTDPTRPVHHLQRAYLILALLSVFLCASRAQGEEPATQPIAPESIDWAKARQFWSFRQPVLQNPPEVKESAWPRQPIDRFVLARLEERGLTHSAEADKITLIRRLTFDLTGLPPSPQDVEAFAVDASANAYENLVERLLASPAFGQRMASMWLPLARYAEDQAHQVGSDTQFFYANAFQYRQWVIDAFNRDLPYDKFITAQLAADKVDGGAENLAALGFIGLGPKYYNRNRLDVQADEWEDRVDTVCRTFLGLTVACARCHDHKFDPITQADYYGLAGVFASTKMVNKTADGKLVDLKDAKAKIPADMMHIVEDGAATDLNVFIRGDVDRKGPVVPRRFLRILCDDEPAPFQDGSGRRELAAAIASRSNPLAARVIVNRVWGLMFGRPLVATPSNFGHSGIPPTHPELLDDLAVRFMNNGWSIKGLIREIALSSTYRQTSRDNPANAATDPDNEQLWRMNRRRLAVEQIRDAVLTVSNELDPAGGKSLELDDPANLRRTVYTRVSRLKLNDFLMQFDYPDANVHAEKRAVTITPIQKLFMLNSPFMIKRAKALAARFTADPYETDAARINRAYHLLFSRAAQPTEIELALDFLSRPTNADLTRWEQYAQMLLVCDEMLYVD